MKSWITWALKQWKRAWTQPSGQKPTWLLPASSDEEYQIAVPVIHEKVNGKAIVVVAGAPPCMEELKKQGIEDFIHIRSNVLETLSAFHRKLGIAHKNTMR